MLSQSLVVMWVRKSSTINDNDIPVSAQLRKVLLKRSYEYLAVRWIFLKMSYLYPSAANVLTELVRATVCICNSPLGSHPHPIVATYLENDVGRVGLPLDAP